MAPWSVLDRRHRQRLDVRCAAAVRIGMRHFPAYTRNLSESGVKLAVKTPLPEGHAVVILLGLRPLEAIVRWWRDGYAGLSFEERLSTEELTRWLDRRQRMLRRGADELGELTRLSEPPKSLP